MFFSLLFSTLFAFFPSTVDSHNADWGDLGDGTYANPILPADYSDPDVIRVGNKYYMTCSEFHFMGMKILESNDMVNWRIVGSIFDRLPLGNMDRMEGSGDGTWAPTLRYYNGRFWMFVCMPNSGLYMSSSPKAEGPWDPLYHVKDVKGWEDPCPLWDTKEGKAYLGHSVLGGGPIIIHEMSLDGKYLLDEGKEVYRGDVAEGTKLYKKDGYYYLSIPEGGVPTGWQTVLRSRSIYGPYEGKRCLEQGKTQINGPHQGALVDTPDGEWWFYHFQSFDPLGRIVHLQPVKWVDGFPFIGKDIDGNGIGEPVDAYSMPLVECKKNKSSIPQSSDNFNSKKLAIQWQWNQNARPSDWSLKERPGWLTMHAAVADRLYTSPNQLAQKAMGYHSVATVKIDYSDMAHSQRAGLACLASPMVAAGLRCDDGEIRVYYENEGFVTNGPILNTRKKRFVWLRLEIDAIKNAHKFSWSYDGKSFNPIGEVSREGSCGWKGDYISLYSYNTQQAQGIAYFDDFIYNVEHGRSSETR